MNQAELFCLIRVSCDFISVFYLVLLLYSSVRRRAVVCFRITPTIDFWASSSVCGFSFISTPLKYLGLTTILIRALHSSPPKPIPKQIPFCSQLRGAHLTAIPPNSTSTICMTKVKIIIPMKSQLLKNPSKTLIQLVNFLLLIWLKICMKTKVQNMIV